MITLFAFITCIFSALFCPVIILCLAQRTRFGGCKAHRGRQMPRNVQCRGRGLSGGKIPALYGAFLPERVLRNPAEAYA